MQNIILAKEDLEEKGIVAFFELVGEKLGVSMDEQIQKSVAFDCRKIEVGKGIRDAIKAYYEEAGRSASFGMEWVCFGPKENRLLSAYEVKTESGFMVFSEN